jgi:hypothetical protein
MAWRSQITEMIRKGICRAFYHVVTLTEDWAQTLPAEYLLTVDIALAISTLNESYGGIGFPFKTYIEAPTKTFIRHCIPLWPLQKVEQRAKIYARVTRKGKIDIAVTHDGMPKAAPTCVIEIKGFGASKREIHKDLVRNADFMALSQLVGEPRLEFTVFVALHRGKAGHVKHKQRDINEVRRTYDTYLSELDLASRVPGLRASCDIYTASENLASDGMNEIQLDDVSEYHHHFIAAIVTFHREP